MTSLHQRWDLLHLINYDQCYVDFLEILSEQLLLFNPIGSECTLSLPPENTKKPYGKVFWYFQEVEKKWIGNKWVNEIS